MRSFCKLFLPVLTILFFFAASAGGKVLPASYGLSANSIDTVYVSKMTKMGMDSLLRVHPLLSGKTVINAVTRTRVHTDRTTDFYLLLFLLLFLGLIRMGNPRYFQSLLRAFWNPTLSNRQLKEQLESARMPNLLMNIFFSIVMGAYMYYAIHVFLPGRQQTVHPVVLLLLLVGGVMLIYIVKYLVVMFSGWVFRVENITEQYLFNVFLINKIMSIVLLPFLVVLVFGTAAWANVLLVISVVLIALLFFNRYVRSWQIFGSFFQYSKFHFFTYFCASELLPLAVLMKLMVRGLLS
ncbi:DUF4271 domain-containing protein [Chitinophagaceae bacterium MMS25-I14]